MTARLVKVETTDRRIGGFHTVAPRGTRRGWRGGLPVNVGLTWLGHTPCGVYVRVGKHARGVFTTEPNRLALALVPVLAFAAGVAVGWWLS